MGALGFFDVLPIATMSHVQLAVGEVVDATNWKVDLPESILESLSSESELEYPLIFALTSQTTKTHVGVRQFSAPESTITITTPIAQALGLSIGDIVKLKHTSLPKGSAVKLKTETALDWKPLLERWLPTNCTALTVGDTLMVSYLGQLHKAVVEELEPENAVCIIDTDLDLEIVGGNQQFDTLTGFEYDMPIALSEVPLTKETPDYLFVEATNGVLYVGPELATSRESFTYRITGTRELTASDLKKLGPSFSVCGYGMATLTLAAPAVESQEGSKLCPVCSKWVPEQSFILHTSFCQRNSIKCECGQVFSRQIPSDHWHCPVCSANGVGFEEAHLKEHEPSTCSCGFEDTFLNVAYHRASDCPERIILCRFCHLSVAQEIASAADKVLGITGHESHCGNRTADCHICGRPVRLRNMEAHMQQHDVQRRSRGTPVTCKNQNCVAIVKDESNALGLCSKCFGPLFSLDNDPDGSRLRARMERKYVLQLSTGCGKSWCTNQYCRTGTGIQRSFKDVLPIVKELLLMNAFYFCVDQIMAKKAMFVYEDGVYDRAWRSMAITQCSNETEAEEWLQTHAPKLGEAV